jgi:hypothetical protein
MRSMLSEAEALVIKANESELGLQCRLDAAQSVIRSMEQRHDALQAELTAARNQSMQLTSQPGAPFYDHVARSVIVCPVLQSNGYIVPFKSVLSKWLEAVGPSDGYPHRTYICPIMQQPTTLASLATQDSIRHIARHAGIDIDPPVVFSYMSDGAWTSFSFHDQLGIVAKVCAAQTMQITECVEHIVVQRNTMAVEINAVQATPPTPFAQNRPACMHTHTEFLILTGGGGCHTNQMRRGKPQHPRQVSHQSRRHPRRLESNRPDPIRRIGPPHTTTTPSGNLTWVPRKKSPTSTIRTLHPLAPMSATSRSHISTRPSVE